MQHTCAGWITAQSQWNHVSGDRSIALFSAGNGSREHEGRSGSLGVQFARIGGHLHLK